MKKSVKSLFCQKVFFFSKTDFDNTDFLQTIYRLLQKECSVLDKSFPVFIRERWSSSNYSDNKLLFYICLKILLAKI